MKAIPDEQRVGYRFGLLVVSERGGRTARRIQNWVCVCDCGGSTITQWSNLTSGHTTSCGCVQRRVRGEGNRTHGRTGTAMYRVWSTMRERCNNPRNNSYRRYGARGIRVCQEWDASFEAFLRDMGERPSPHHSIDRIDTNGDYCPENCQWATSTQQARNTSGNRLIEYAGEIRCVSEWAEIRGMQMFTLFRRLNAGWPVEKALNHPVGPDRRNSRRGLRNVPRDISGTLLGLTAHRLAVEAGEVE